ncbi:MAG: Cysteine desulfurase IscS [Chlamydiae bacterium]|nr:Cysteine desulfurase IscS [Chlamydiota bacterium]
MNRIYLDHHSASKLDERVLAHMLPYFQEKWGSYSQPHEEGQKILPDILKAFGIIKDFISLTDSETLILTSSPVEATNHVYDHVYHKVVRETGRNHFITLESEQAALLMPLKKLESLGCYTTYLTVNNTGSTPVQGILDAITPRTAMITLSLANGITGVFQDLEGLKETCDQRGILLHLEVSYALGKVDVDFQNLKADFLTFSGEMLHGPRSSGILVAKDSAQLAPFIAGGLEQNGLRGGALDVACLAGLAKACELAKKHLSEMSLEVARLRNQFEKKLLEELDGVQVLFKNQSRLPNVSVVSFKNVHADYLLYTLNKRGIAACLGGGLFQKLSLLLESMEYTADISHTSLSFAFSRDHTHEDIQKVVGILIEEVKRLRLMSEHLELSHEN